MKVYAPGLPVTVLDGAPVEPAPSSAAGRVTVYAHGQVVEVRDCGPAVRPPPITRTISQTRNIWFDAINNGQRYNRWQNLIVLKGAATLDFRILAAGGARLTFQGATYSLLCDGVVIASVTPPVGTQRATFSFDASTLPEGWRVMDVQGPETCSFHPMFVLHGDIAPPQAWMPVVTSTYEHKSASPHQLVWVPTTHAPTVLPLPLREYPYFSDAKSRTLMNREEIVPVREGDLRRPSINKNGIMSTFNLQWYTWSSFIAKLPAVPLLDGPRGVGTLGYITHIEVGSFVLPSTGKPLGNLYVLDPWRVVKVRPNGSISTLVGYRHKPTPSYWQDPPELELVGDWSAIPPERRGFHETWGMCWDPASLITDTNAQHIPVEGNLQPHLGAGPVMFVADSQNNRICKITFTGGSSANGSDARHGLPPVVTEFITGLGDPWDCVEWQGKLIVSERTSHRICQYHMQTGALERVIISGAPLSQINSGRFVERLAPIAQIQAEPCVGPEGLYVMDDWLYFGSEAMQQIKRVHLIDGRVELVKGYVSGKNQYLKIAVSDGTFGPRHTVFVTGWTNSLFGAPAAFLPDGTGWSVAASTSSSTARGRGGDWTQLLYNAAVACRFGRLVYGAAGEGLVIVSAALPTDATPDRKVYSAGRLEWALGINRLTQGDAGWGFYGDPLPWGQSAAQDYYLSWQGHQG